MASRVTVRLVKIGNSQSIRIPQALLKQVGFSGEMQMEVENDRLILRSSTGPRQGWDAEFERMAERGDDELLDREPLLLTQWEENEWEW